MGYFIRVIKIILIIVLPFFLLVRGAIHIHLLFDPGPWISLFAGVGFSSTIIFLYISIFKTKITRRFSSSLNQIKLLGFLSVGMVTLYCIYGLFFISSHNLQNAQLQREITDLHPILRLGVSTFTLMDKSLIITDASRVPEDYKRMGLPTKSSSLHYTQEDGYAYAIDLRTNGRYEIRNFLMAMYFKIQGFQVMRHVGTDDHLHVSLKCHYKPYSK